MRLQWNDDVTVCGRYVINSEHVRGEPKLYWLMSIPEEGRVWLESQDQHARGEYVCSRTSMHAVKRWAQRIENAISSPVITER